ncbi:MULTISPECIES: histidinol dehydrogenase [unclassified Curtobacterium]|uniref:histidinol dehydrogenase n=1 Tax=unclassified Curtobacterium TaxID=257496 RepID=UPI000DA908A4|nr:MULTISPECIES: histidinol dehydrogenase [unclassified Curtobacterium]PZE29980.1 histidinol dehydrogenase [Curtobacterium sp. MCBD17_028]PZF61031.1 histidinol dehydrogenase [Curtobacterium sp. MCBD17_034]PZM40381.1 histidinol dehydrogenase [Curtobacterium sp. MCBD17_031]
MMRRIDLRGGLPDRAELLRLMPRAAGDVASATTAARDLVDDVRDRGAAALREQAERFDGGAPGAVRVGAAAIGAAVAGLDPVVRNALDEAIRRVRAASTAQVPQAAITTLADGAEVHQRWRPVRRVGLYVPGGKAVYPSSVVMNVVPAQVAGVRSIALVSPPQRDHGHGVHPTILGAAGLLGVDEVYAMGGAGAIGALAHGVPEIGLEPVDLVTGPGNNYVAAAKRLVRGLVGIDAEAGATEILVIADASADAEYVAADLVSQAEHDEQAGSVLVTTSEALADAVDAAIPAQLARLATADRVRVALGGPQSAVVLVGSLTDAAAVSNAYGPEHLEIQTEDDDAVLAEIDSAGAVFVGPSAPVSLGDYLAGSNHVLPTGGQARFGAGLSAATFLRPQQIVRYDAEALAEVGPRIVALAEAEQLPAHGAAVAARLARS